MLSYISKLKLVFFLCIFIVLLSCKQTSKQSVVANISTSEKVNKTLKIHTSKSNNYSNELLEFIPPNYSILDTVAGDLNLDGITDYILVLKDNDERTLSNVVDNPEKRPLLILLRNKENKLYLARKNDNTVYCFDCGGIMGDPFTGITIKNGYFSVEHYGGSAWRWTRIVTYKYSKQEDEWFLYKDGSVTFHTSDPEKTESDIKTTKDFGKIKFEDFNIYE